MLFLIDLLEAYKRVAHFSTKLSSISKEERRERRGGGRGGGREEEGEEREEETLSFLKATGGPSEVIQSPAWKKA